MGCTVQFAPLVVGMSSSSSGGFRTPKSAVWNKGVTAQAPVSGGSCKKIQCDNCETMFAGGSRRILRVFKMKTTAHRKKNQRGFVLLTRQSNFPGLWLKPKGPTKDFGLILSRSKVVTSFLLTFARELSTTKDQF
jgi:hypothetical protein